MFDFKGLISALFNRSSNTEGVHNLRSATQMLQELPESDMLMAQVEIIQALKQLNTNEKINVKERFKTIPYLDEKARVMQAHLMGVYHGTIIDKGAPLSQVLLTITAFWNEMGHAYQQCIKQAVQTSNRSNNSALALFTLRAMRYYFEHAKWCYLRYMEVDSRTWRHINRLYLFAEQEGLADGQLQAYPDCKHSSIKREYIKILMLTLAAPEKLPSHQIELVTEWLDKWVHHMDIDENLRTSQHIFAINVAGSTPPKRLRRDMVGSNWRYWGTETLSAHVKASLKQLQSGAWATELDLPEKTSQPANIMLMEKLSDLWSHDVPAPARRHERSPTQKTIRILRGLDAIIEHISKHNSAQQNRTAFEIDPAHWSVENESINGMGVHFQHTADHKLLAGEVVGILPEDSPLPLSIGIVRRLSKQRDGLINAGIETIALTPLLINLTPKQSNKCYQAIFSPANEAYKQSRFLLVPQKQYAENREFTLSAQGKAYRISLSPAHEHTTSATIAGFSVLARAS